MIYRLYNEVQETINEFYNLIINFNKGLAPAYAFVSGGSLVRDAGLESKIGFYEMGKGGHGSNHGKSHKAKRNAGKKWKDMGGKKRGKGNLKNNKNSLKN